MHDLTILAVRYPGTLRVISPESTDTGAIIQDIQAQKLGDDDAMLIRDGEDMWSGSVGQFKEGMIP